MERDLRLGWTGGLPGGRVLPSGASPAVPMELASQLGRGRDCPCSSNHSSRIPFLSLGEQRLLVLVLLVAGRDTVLFRLSDFCLPGAARGRSNAAFPWVAAHVPAHFGNRRLRSAAGSAAFWDCDAQRV